jgi:hypothetical protein
MPLSASDGPDDQDNAKLYATSDNVFQRYMHWAGTRSIIFQSLFLGWTAFAVLSTCGLNFALVKPGHQMREEREAEASSIMLASCCGCGGYLLFAVPLGIAAIATLETRKRRLERLHEADDIDPR